MTSSEQVSVDILPWWKRFTRQLSVLLCKQAIIGLRNWKALLLRVSASFFFLLLLYVADQAIQKDNENLDRFKSVRNPTPEVVKNIPKCEDDIYIKKDKDCYDMLYTCADATGTSQCDTTQWDVVETIIARMRTNNKPIIPVNKVLRQETRESSDAWLLSNPEQAISAVHFYIGEDSADASRSLSFSVQANYTPKAFKGEFQDPNFFVQVPLQNAAHREVTRQYLLEAGNAAPIDPDDLQWDVSYVEFAHPATGTLSIVGAVSGPFLFAANMFSFVLLMYAVVQEREMGLRRSMSMMGLLDSAWWVSWMLWEFVLALVFALLTTLWGKMFQFDSFNNNSFALIFCTFLLFQMAMSSFAMAIASLIRKAMSAIVVGFALFIVGWIASLVVLFGVIYTPDNYDKWGGLLPILFSAIPSNLLVKVMNDLGQATSDKERPGISWSRRFDYCKEEDGRVPCDDGLGLCDESCVEQRSDICECKLPAGQALWIFVILWLGYLYLAIYLDNILPDEYGNYRPAYYLLDPGYWLPGFWEARKKPKGSREPRGPYATAVHRVKPSLERQNTADAVGAVDDGVGLEEDRMRALLAQLQQTGAAVNPASSPLSADGNAPDADSSALINDADRSALEVFGLQRFFRDSGSKKKERASGRGGNRTGWTSVEALTEEDVQNGHTQGMAVQQQQQQQQQEEARPTKSDGRFWAVKGSWFSIQEGQLFCLLGPNGAGKSTTIHVLTGMLPASGGDAIIYGNVLSSPIGRESIRTVMGVCPQFDVLFDELTGREHLQLYAYIKGIPHSKVNLEVDRLLEKVSLTKASHVRSGAYSGGMRRRLSVAIALLGNPRILFLDEPTTGMDPVSRREVWDIIESLKEGRVVVLTTHSMEEADILGDRIGIMARGNLRALGSSLRLKQRFGTGYQLAVAVAEPGISQPELERRSAGVKQLLRSRLQVEVAEESKAYITFMIPQAQESQLGSLLQELEQNSKPLGIIDTQLRLASLEEVFLTIAKQAEMEAAKLAGRERVETDVPGQRTLLIPMGVERVMDPGTGVWYRVAWSQDDTGRLSVLSATPETAPAGAQVEMTSTS